MDDYDIVVIGGGVAGVFAAIGASSSDRKVLLIEQNTSLGGQGTLTGERQFCGDVTHVNEPFQE
ncbi:MAG: FAD-dependent oxidoreductase, partial [Theionarchaea archaeon]|nr:FAD-dependent oxidoreductase [Theionarchaea archaeon]